MVNKMFVSKNDRQDDSLTGQVRDQAGHCPLTCRYFQPCPVSFSFVQSISLDNFSVIFSTSNHQIVDEKN